MSGCEQKPLCCSRSQDDYVEALGRLHLTVSRAYKVNPDINFEVFIHKVDGLSDDHKIATQRDIHQRANDDLADASLDKLHLRWVSATRLCLEPRIVPTVQQLRGFTAEILETQRDGATGSRTAGAGRSISLPGESTKRVM